MRYDAKFISIREAAAVEGTSFSSMRRRLHEASKSTPELLDLGNPQGSVNVDVFRRVILGANQANQNDVAEADENAIRQMTNDIDVLKRDVARLKRLWVERFPPLP